MNLLRVTMNFDNVIYMKSTLYHLSSISYSVEHYFLLLLYFVSICLTRPYPYHVAILTFTNHFQIYNLEQM